MGTKITATAIVQSTLSSLEMTAQAGLACVEKSGINLTDVDLLINIGIAHDENIMEPAMSPLILQKMGLNLDPIKQQTNFTMCFDLYNDACGFMYAARTADAFLRNGEARSVMIVSGDIHPSRTIRDDFPYAPVGAAVLLTYDRQEETSGFSDFYFKTSDDHDEEFTAGAHLQRAHEKGIKGKDYIEVYQDENFADNLYDFMIQSGRNYFPHMSLDPEKIKFLVSSQQINNFGKRLYGDLGLTNGTRIVDVGEYGTAHTASIPMGLHVLREDGGLKKNDSALIAAGGAGLTAAYAIYTE